MKVGIKKLEVEMMLGNNGITLPVYANGKKGPDGELAKDIFKGNLIIKRGGVEWCPGKAKEGIGGILKTWEDFIDWFEDGKKK